MAHLGRSIAVGAIMTVAAGGLAAPAAHAGGGDHGDRHGGDLSLTRSAAATLDRLDVDVDVVNRDRDRRDRRSRSGGDDLRGATIVFDGERTTRWRNIRVNHRTNRVTAVVGGDRRPVLRFRDGARFRGDVHLRGGDRGTVLRLTVAGARTIDRAARADAFDAGDPFATIDRR